MSRSAAIVQGNVLVVDYFVKSRFRSVVDRVPSVDTSTLYSEMLLLVCVHDLSTNSSCDTNT